MADHGSSHYVKIWKTLLILLIISVLGPELEIKIVTLITAFGIAVVKAYMVAKYFMHVNIERKYVHYILITGISFMLIFYFGVAPDVMKHHGAELQVRQVGAADKDVRKVPQWNNVAAKIEIRKQMDKGCKDKEFHDTDLCQDYYKALGVKPPEIDHSIGHHGDSDDHHEDSDDHHEDSDDHHGESKGHH